MNNQQSQPVGQLPGYITSASCLPKDKRAPWYKTSAPTYAGVFLWFAFWDPISRGVLSHYGKEATLWVKSPRGEVPIGEYTPLYQRYAEAATLARLYVEPERWEEARRLLGMV